MREFLAPSRSPSLAARELPTSLFGFLGSRPPWSCPTSTHPREISRQREADIHLPEKYKEFSDVFDKVKANTLSEHRPYDCPIDLQPGKEPLWGSIYNLSPIELDKLREYIDDNLANGFIRHSRSPVGAPIFFVKKKNGTLRLVVDYRGLNKLTIRNRYALASILNLLECLWMNGRQLLALAMDILCIL